MKLQVLNISLDIPETGEPRLAVEVSGELGVVLTPKLLEEFACSTVIQEASQDISSLLLTSIAKGLE